MVTNVDEAVSAVESLKSLNRQDCREWANTQFSCDKMAADYFKLYQKILG
ncbi:hypothetical protein [Mucilaginibacter antarcticus]